MVAIAWQWDRYLVPQNVFLVFNKLCKFIDNTTFNLIYVVGVSATATAFFRMTVGQVLLRWTVSSPRYVEVDIIN